MRVIDTEWGRLEGHRLSHWPARPGADDGGLGDLRRKNPLFRPATEQMPIAGAWHHFHSTHDVRVTEQCVSNIARIIEGDATPESALAGMPTGVRRRLPP